VHMILNRLKRRLARYPFAVKLKRRLDETLGFSAHLSKLTHANLEQVDRSVIEKKMMTYWTKDLGVSERTTRTGCAALNFDRFGFDIEQIKRRFGSLSGKLVADIGCGWGSFLLLLQREGLCSMPATSPRFMWKLHSCACPRRASSGRMLVVFRHWRQRGSISSSSMMCSNTSGLCT